MNMLRNITMGLCIAGFCVAELQAGCRQNKPGVHTMHLGSLKRNKVRIQQNDPALLPAYKKLIKDADEAMQFGPVSVMEKKHIPPSGDKHDYMSLAPYHWPDPSKPDGLPYIRKDGQTNPEVREYKDKEYMPRLCEVVYTLALAHYFSDNEAYADQAAHLLRVWFLDTATRMNPNLNYAQAIKGVNTGRGAGLIDSRHFIKIVDAIGLLQRSKRWKPAYHQGMKLWFRDFLHWMQTSAIGRDEMDAPNNHGVWYDAQRLALALFIDSTALAKDIFKSAWQRLDTQMDDKGRFPKEMERTISLHYSVFVMNAFATIAQMAGNDFWNNTTSSGKSIRKGFDQLLPYLLQEKQWEGQQIKPFEFEDAILLLKEGALRYDCKSCENGIKKIAGDKYERLRIHLLY